MNFSTRYNKDEDNQAKTFNHKCRLCGKDYDNLVDMQRHELVYHVQKGNVPKEKE